MRYETDTGKTISAESLAAARRIATEYGMGAVIGKASPKPASMSPAKAKGIWLAAQAWPRCGDRWPMYPDERAAEAVLSENPDMRSIL